MTESLNRRYIPELDQIRGIAALLIVLYHGLQIIGADIAYGQAFNPQQHWLFGANPVLTVIEEGHTAVGLFIVLSGFVLTLGVAGREIDYRLFLAARFLRIYPMLIVCVLIGSIVAPTTLQSILTSLLPISAQGGVGTVFTAMFWAVVVEFQCYLIFPWLNSLVNSKGIRFLLHVILLALTFRLLVVYSTDASPRDISYRTILGRIDQFCIGMALARLYVQRGWANCSPFWIIPSVAAVVLLLVTFNAAGGYPNEGKWKIIWPTVEAVMWSAFIVSFLSFGRQLPRIMAAVMTWAGKVSYSVYLLHFAVLIAVVRSDLYVELTGRSYLDALITTAVVVAPLAWAIGAMTYSMIERPFLSLRPKYVRAG